MPVAVVASPADAASAAAARAAGAASALPAIPTSFSSGFVFGLFAAGDSLRSITSSSSAPPDGEPPSSPVKSTTSFVLMLPGTTASLRGFRGGRAMPLSACRRAPSALPRLRVWWDSSCALSSAQRMVNDARPRRIESPFGGRLCSFASRAAFINKANKESIPRGAMIRYNHSSSMSPFPEEEEADDSDLQLSLS